MRSTHPPRRGNILLVILIGLSLIGALLLVAGVVTFLVANPSKAASDLENQFKAFVENSTPLEAPGSFEVEIKKGGAAFFLSPDGKVGDKVIPIPPADISYSVAVTDLDGNPMKFEANRVPRGANDPFYYMGFCETAKDGKYKIKIDASDSKTKAAVVVAPGSKEELAGLMGALGKAAIGVSGGCAAICGLLALLCFGIPALIVRKRSRPDPLAL